MFCFKGKKSDQYSESEFQLHLYRSRNIALLIVLLGHISPRCIELIIDINEFKVNIVPKTINFLFSFCLLIVLQISLVKFHLLEERKAWRCIKIILFTLDLLTAALICAFYTCFIHKSVERFGGEPYKLVVLSWLIWVYITTVSQTIYNWSIRITATIGIGLYLIVKAGEEFRHPEEKAILGRGISFILLLIGVAYNFKKFSDIRFSKKDNAIKTEKVWKRVLNSLPEGLLIMSKDKAIKYCNQSLLDLVLDDESRNLQDLSPVCYNGAPETLVPENLRIFKSVTVAYCDDRLKSSLCSISKENKQNDEEEGLNASLASRGLQESENYDEDIYKFCKFDNFSIFLNKMISKWSQFHEGSEQMGLKNDTNLLVLDSNLYSQSHGAQRSFQIKIWFTSFEDSQAMVIIFSETTQMRLIHSLQDSDNYKSRLLASVSHELLTPLNGSINFLQCAVEEVNVPIEIKNNLLVPAVRSNLLLLHMINDILDFSQVNARKLQLSYESRDIQTSLDECLQLVELQANKKGLALLSNIDLTSNNFSTDHIRLKQILLNLLSNAVKCTQEGYVKINMSEYYEGEHSDIRMIKLDIEDTGTEISNADRIKLFTGFNRISSGSLAGINMSGLGLGFIISNILVKRLGPRSRNYGIKVDSNKKGSNFSFILEDKGGAECIFQRIKTRAEFESPLFSPSRKHLEVHSLNHAKTIKFRGVRSQPDKSLARSTKNPSALSFNFEDKSKEESESLATLPNEKDYENCQPTSYIFTINKSLTKINRYGRQSNDLFDVASSIELIEASCICPRVLVVDDDGFNILAMENLLDSLKVSFEYAYNGQEAIQKVLKRTAMKCSSTSCKPYQLIFMDCNMPVMDGFTAAQKLKELMFDYKIPVMPIIACTALVQSSDIENVFNSGMDDYCSKPISKDKIKKVLECYNVQI